MTAGACAATAASNGRRSRASSSSRVASSTGITSWLSAVAPPWPGKCFVVETSPAASYPVTAAAVASAARAGSEEGDRLPIVGSAAPMVTSATGAKTQVKPSCRSSRAVDRAASVTTCSPVPGSAAIASPASAKAGKSVATPRRWATRPPSWSTPTTAGKDRPSSATASLTAAVVASTCSPSTTLSLVTQTPARCRSRTIAPASSGSVPW